jgi:nucleoside-diphosphate-sugar epimerase
MSSNPAKILITGGGGYLGYHIALVLKAAGKYQMLMLG